MIGLLERQVLINAEIGEVGTGTAAPRNSLPKSASPQSNPKTSPLPRRLRPVRGAQCSVAENRHSTRSSAILRYQEEENPSRNLEFHSKDGRELS